MSNKVQEVIAHFDGMVSPDGGRVMLIDDGSDGSSTVRVRYEMAPSGECETCVITPEMLETFLKESLSTHGVDADEVVVDTASR